MIKSLIIVLLFPVFLLSFSLNVFAQNGGLFQTTPVITQTLTGYQHNADESVPLDSVTTITVPKGSFSNQATLYAYKGNESQIKYLVPQGQSPISSYQIIFKDTLGKPIQPITAIKIAVNNIYKNTPTYFYPVINGGIDQGLVKQLGGGILAIYMLSVNDNGFIATANSSSLSQTSIQTPTQAVSPVQAKKTADTLTPTFTHTIIKVNPTTVDSARAKYHLPGGRTNVTTSSSYLSNFLSIIRRNTVPVIIAVVVIIVVIVGFVLYKKL